MRETILYLEKTKYDTSLYLAQEMARVLKTTIGELLIFEDERDTDSARRIC